MGESGRCLPLELSDGEDVPMVDLTGYRLTFDEEFNTRSISLTGSGTTWASTRQEWRHDGYSDIGFGISSFVDASSGYDPFNVSNGVLAITAVPDRTPYGYPGAWESGLISTQGDFSQTYGYFEVRADLSDAPGGWDAFWLLPNVQIPDPNNLGHWQELDVLEHYGVWDKGIYSGIHTTDPAPNEHWQQYLQVYSEMPSPSGYHTYGMNWQADRISFYIDGQLVGSQATPSDMHAPMYLLLDLAVQDPANIAGVPLTSKIDYVRVYSADPNAQAVALDTTSSPDGSDPGLHGAVAAGSPPPSQPGGTTAVTIGSGADTLVLKLSQDAYLGDALYTVSVDGVQVGGTLTASASHGTGQSDIVTVLGNWSAGAHNVFIHLLNDRWDGTPTTDRNLYLDSAAYNGAAVPDGALGNLVGQSFSFQDSATTPPPATNPPPTTTPPPTPSDPAGTTIGSGADTLVLKLSQDAYLDDALYTVSVDGVQVGGTLTASASHGTGQSDIVTVLGSWSAGAHNVFIHFLNDRWDGTPTTDRNLYLDSAAYNGAAVPDGALGNLLGQSFTFYDHIA
jgi:beta-glucanase (GH16 family)